MNKKSNRAFVWQWQKLNKDMREAAKQRQRKEYRATLALGNGKQTTLGRRNNE